MVLNDVDSYNHAISVPLKQVVQELIDVLGPTVVAAIGGVNETRAVMQWLNGRKPQRPHVLRFALQLARMIALKEDVTIIRAWFQGTNPGLEDRSPALLLRSMPLGEIQGPLMAAARTFAARDDE
ncbi:MAG TPA: hypothetical protein VFE36_05310 [Candidatus Baltobacteraceae bacterium]|nr:hypothetical protein [Candidatus Baltobacteraceae bacterium]